VRGARSPVAGTPAVASATAGGPPKAYSPRPFGPEFPNPPSSRYNQPVTLHPPSIEALLASGDDGSVARYVIEGIPWIFRDRPSDLANWRADIEAALSPPPEALYLVGSSAVGFSLNPNKPGRPFRRSGNDLERPSDIDVAVVSEGMFHSAWDVIRQLDRERSLATSRDERDTIRTNVYWGFVSQITLPRGSALSRIIRTAMAMTTARKPFRGHLATARIYRRTTDLHAYQAQCIRKLRMHHGVTR